MARSSRRTGSSGITLQITDSPHFGGSLLADPPVLQLGESAAVKLSAVVQNDGNQALASESCQEEVGQAFLNIRAFRHGLT